MSVKQSIKVTNAGLSPILSVAQGTGAIEYEFTVSDFDIPSGSAAVAYNIQPTGNIVSQTCSISGNTITVKPPAYYFLRGKNYMQFQVSRSNEDLFSFLIEVWCAPNISQPEVIVAENPSLVSQLISDVGLLSSQLDNLLSIPSGSLSTSADAALADIKVGWDGTTYDTPGDAVRGQIGELNDGLVLQKSVKIQYLSDRTTWKQNTYWTPSLVEASADGYTCTKLNRITSGTYTIIGLSPDFSFVIPESGTPKSFKALFGSFSMIKPKTITLENCNLLLTSYHNAPICMMCDGESIPSNYMLGIFDFVEPLSDRIKEITKKGTTKIIVGTSDKATFSDLGEAIKSIKDSNADNIYDIMLENGTYNILMDMTKEDGFLPDYVNIIGASGDKDKVIIAGENTENAISSDVINCSTLNIQKNNNIENVTITARNCRYAVHSESSGAIKNWSQKIKNCKLVHYGNTGNAFTAWSSCHAWGEGASSGSYAEFDGVEFKAPYYPAYIHEPPTEDNIIPYHHIFKNCEFTNNINAISASAVAMEIDNTRNNNCVHKVDFIDCNFGCGILSVMGNYDIDVTVHGCNNVPIRRGDNSTTNNYYKNFPTTEYTTIKRYIGDNALTGGEILAYTENSNNCILATPNTPKELIIGIFNGNAKKNDFVNINAGLFYLSDFSYNKKLYVGENGKLSENGEIPIAFSLGRCAKFID